jgi:hypothetical protein
MRSTNWAGFKQILADYKYVHQQMYLSAFLVDILIARICTVRISQYEYHKILAESRYKARFQQFPGLNHLGCGFSWWQFIVSYKTIMEEVQWYVNTTMIKRKENGINEMLVVL